MSQFQYDAYLSCSRRDHGWVRSVLLPRLVEAGLRVLLEEDDFSAGSIRSDQNNLGWLNCRRILLILTPHYFADGGPEVERVLLQTRNPESFRTRLIPLLKSGAQTPRWLAGLAQLDFSEGADLELAWKQLLIALGKPPDTSMLAQPARSRWHLAHPYATPPIFTGRRVEHRMLTEWLQHDTEHPLLVLRALGGFGKSALAWHWLMEEVDPEEWSRIVWWSFYENDASFESFLAQALAYLSEGLLDPRAIPLREQVSKVLRALEQPGTLLVLDGFERALRAFGGLNPAYHDDDAMPHPRELDCLSPLAEDFLHRIISQPGIYGKVLLTTRHLPRVLTGPNSANVNRCREVELAQMHPAEAVDFFQAHGIRGGRADIEAISEAVGYHPLTLRLLAGMILGNDHQAGDIAAIFPLELSGDLVQRQHQVLEESDHSLTAVRKNLLAHIACFRGPVDYDALQAIASSISGLVTDLRDLESRGLLQHDRKTDRFDLHPIVRHYAYSQLPVSDRAAAHAQLRDYFSAMPRRKNVQSVDDLSPVIELYHHTIRAGQFDEAHALYSSRLAGCISYQFGAYQLEIDLLLALFPEGEDRPPRLTNESAQAWTLNSLANSYSFSGQPRRSAPLFERVNPTFEKSKDRSNLAISLANLADDQAKIGALRSAEANLMRSIALCREMGNELQEAVGHQELGRLLAYRGEWTGADAALAAALKMGEDQNHVQLQGVVWAYRALRELQRQRQSFRRSFTGLPTSGALTAARRALELAEETASVTHFVYPVRDYVRAHWLIGASERLGGQFDEADRHLHEALSRCRRNNLVETEADILVDLARLRVDMGEPAEARRLAEEAILITERSGCVLPGADAHLVLASLASRAGDPTGVARHASEAARLATCDGPPDYAYRAAYAEAGQWLCELTTVPG